VPGPFELLILPFALGLLGFVEPCSLGGTMLFIKFLEGKPATAKLVQVAAFLTSRMLLIGALGGIAAVIGAAFIGFQKAMWVVLGSLYLLIGVALLLGKGGALMRGIGPGLARLKDTRGAVGLGLLFGLNIPACAAPLIFALLGLAAAGGATTGAIAQGFVSLAVFGFALSLPLIAAVLFAPARRLLDWAAGLSARAPLITGLVLVALGLWSIGFAFLVNLEEWTI
jgi:cytochrome c-type biogenesis protein